MRRRQVLAIVGWGLVGALAPAAGLRADTASGPSDTIRAFYDVLLEIMRNAAALGPRGRYQRLEPMVQKSFDLPFMTKLSIGPPWGHLPPEQKQQASTAFGRYFTALYANRFDGYSGEQFKLLGEQKIKHGELVRTQIVKSNGEAVSINYVLHDNDVAWQIRDVYVGGTISELATRRSEFSAILRTQGIDGLITALNQKADAVAS
jgi:phospholipid transport system substrate-binding protein